MSYQMSQIEMDNNTIENQQYLGMDADQDMFWGDPQEGGLQELQPEEFGRDMDGTDTGELNGEMEGPSHHTTQAGLFTAPDYEHSWSSQDPSQQLDPNDLRQDLSWNDGQNNRQPTSPSFPLPLGPQNLFATPCYHQDWQNQDPLQQLSPTPNTGWNNSQNWQTESVSQPRGQSPAYLTPEDEADNWQNQDVSQQPLSNEPDSNMTESNEHELETQILSQQNFAVSENSYGIHAAHISKFETSNTTEDAPSFNSCSDYYKPNSNENHNMATNDSQTQTQSYGISIPNQSKPMTYTEYRQMMAKKGLSYLLERAHRFSSDTNRGMAENSGQNLGSEETSPSPLSDHTNTNDYILSIVPAPTEFRYLPETLEDSLLNQPVSVLEVQRQCAEVSEVYRRRKEAKLLSQSRNSQPGGEGFHDNQAYEQDRAKASELYGRRKEEYAISESCSFQGGMGMIRSNRVEQQEQAVYQHHQQHQHHNPQPHPHLHPRPRPFPQPQAYQPFQVLDFRRPPHVNQPHTHSPSSPLAGTFPPQQRQQPRKPRSHPSKPKRTRPPPLSPQPFQAPPPPLNPPTIPPESSIFSGQTPGYCPIPCPSCTLTFPTVSLLKTHSAFHDLSKPYVCCILGCNARFKDVQKLTIHLRGHQGHIRCVGKSAKGGGGWGGGEGRDGEDEGEGEDSGEEGCGMIFYEFSGLERS